jgi:hypothetical protein
MEDDFADISSPLPWNSHVQQHGMSKQCQISFPPDGFHQCPLSHSWKLTPFPSTSTHDSSKEFFIITNYKQIIRRKIAATKQADIRKNWQLIVWLERRKEKLRIYCRKQTWEFKWYLRAKFLAIPVPKCWGTNNWYALLILHYKDEAKWHSLDWRKPKITWYIFKVLPLKTTQVNA